jgi:hypothetical protein
MQESAMNLIAKRVMSNRGDCRLAVDICRQALDIRVDELTASRKTWDIQDGAQALDLDDLDKYRQITAKDVNEICNNRQLDPELGKSNCCGGQKTRHVGGISELLFSSQPVNIHPLCTNRSSCPAITTTKPSSFALDS